MKFTSERGEWLIWSNHGHLPSVETITVEDADKWYSLYVVTPAGIVCQLLFGDLEPFRVNSLYFVDHCPNPDSVELLAEARGWQVDVRALEVMHGRWRIEVENP